MFESLSLVDRQALALCFTGRRCVPGEIVFREGDPGGSLFLVGEGSLVAVSRAGERASLLFSRPKGPSREALVRLAAAIGEWSLALPAEARGRG